MTDETWKILLRAMTFIGVSFVILYYFNPDIFTIYDSKTGNMTTMSLSLLIYVSLFIILALLRYFLYKKTHANVVGLWSIAPVVSGGTVFVDGKTIAQNGTVNLLTDSDAKTFLAETFTFGFFVRIDKSSTELMHGENLKSKNGLFQNILVVPGAYSISIDPLHENMAIIFDSYKTNPYRIEIPTISVQRWHQIVISIEGRIADIYQNGNLVKSVPLPNVINNTPTNPYVVMNSDMYAKIALVQSWPLRLMEESVINNYRINTDAQGTPTLPEVSNIFGVPKFDFCLGTTCFGPSKPDTTALTTVEYTYA